MKIFPTGKVQLVKQEERRPLLRMDSSELVLGGDGDIDVAPAIRLSVRRDERCVLGCSIVESCLMR
ncbi:hypothetical protein N8494_01130 [bacterium]|nr:hypothetical protein [bacterium]